MRGAVRSVNPSVGRVLMNTETHEPIGTCGSQYVPIQNKVVRDAAWKALTSQVPAHLLKDIKQNEYVEDNGAFYRCDWNILVIPAKFVNWTVRLLICPYT